MADAEGSKPRSTKLAAVRSRVQPLSIPPISPDTMKEGEVSPQIMPLVTILADTIEGGGARGATPDSTNHLGRPTNGNDVPCPHSMVRSLSPWSTQNAIIAPTKDLPRMIRRLGRRRRSFSSRRASLPPPLDLPLVSLRPLRTSARCLGKG